MPTLSLMSEALRDALASFVRPPIMSCAPVYPMLIKKIIRLKGWPMPSIKFWHIIFANKRKCFSQDIYHLKSVAFTSYTIQSQHIFINLLFIQSIFYLSINTKGYVILKTFLSLIKLSHIYYEHHLLNKMHTRLLILYNLLMLIFCC